MASRQSSSPSSRHEEPWANVHHSCEYCLKAFPLDFSEDKQHPSGLPANRWALIERRLGDDAPKFLERVKEGQAPQPFGLARTLTKEVTFFDVNTPDLESWAAQGCLFCRHLLDRMADAEEKIGGTRVLGVKKGPFLDLSSESAMSIMIFDLATYRSDRLHAFSLWTYHVAWLSNGCLGCDMRRPALQPVNPTPSSPSSLSQYRTWLETCRRTHRKCPKPSEFVPTRLLELSKTPEGLVEARLCETCEKDNVEPFAALSYCWGGDQPLKLTKSTRIQLLEHIKPEELPQTLSDAINVTISLGIKYLWIDALCIIQDDNDDKGRELGKMSMIYSCALVTLVASRAEAVQKGFLQDRPIGNIPGFGLRGHLPASEPCVFLIPRQDFENMGRSDISKANKASYISQRAWCFQERLLSPRIIDFGAVQTIWWCQESEDTSAHGRPQWTDGWEKPGPDEDHSSMGIVAKELACWEYPEAQRKADTKAKKKRPGKTSGKAKGSWYEKIEKQLIGQLAALVISKDMKTRSSQWARVVERYTLRQLNFYTDRLPAISAMAQVFHSRNKSGYVAGLWADMMPRALLWGRGSSYLWPRPEGGYCGPTWSWVAMVGPANLNGNALYDQEARDMDTERHGNIVSWDLTPLHDSPGSEIIGLRSAALTFHGRLKPVYWWQPPVEEWTTIKRPPSWRDSRLPRVPLRAGAPTAIGFNPETGTVDPTDPDMARLDSLPPKPRLHPSIYLFTSDIKGSEELIFGHVQFDVFLPAFEADTRQDKTRLFLLPMATDIPWTRSERLKAIKTHKHYKYLKEKLEKELQDPWGPHVQAIVLQQSAQSGRYERVGIFHYGYMDEPGHGVHMSNDEFNETYKLQYQWLHDGEKQDIYIV